MISTVIQGSNNKGKPSKRDAWESMAMDHALELAATDLYVMPGCLELRRIRENFVIFLLSRT